ncbi:flagellar hook protein [Lachnospiraceae bacterium MD335]|nr:flagellar hook protein [Lachnospiraceae bacterium MD335]
MVVRHNLMAMNAGRMLKNIQGALTASTEKLSSGYAINRAADNAAGLAISEKMRKQIRGLTQASANAEDGISAVQTAEGALTEVHEMLQRLNELAVQAANGTNSEDDRSYIQDEVDQITQEIDRVSETTKFNETYLLKGNTLGVKGYSFRYAKGNAAQKASVSFDADGATGATLTISFENPDTKDKISVSDQNNLAKALRDQGATVSAKTVTSTDPATGATTASKEYVFELNGSDAKANYKVITTDAKAGTFEIQDLDGNKIASATVQAIGAGESAVMTAKTATAAKSENEVYAFYDKDGNVISENSLGRYLAVSSTGTVIGRADAPAVYDALGNEISLKTDVVDNKLVAGTKNMTAALKMSFHVGADGTDNNKININIDAMTAKSLGLNGLKVSGEDGRNATKAIDIINASIRTVSRQRSALGAVQNRLEHTIKNLDNVVENTQSAEAAIRDTDMAAEMVKYSNTTILAQMAQSMLAQANQSNQGVLSILG